MKANEPLELKSRRFTPARLEIAMIIICVIVSAICLAYELYKFIKAKGGDKKVLSRDKVMDKSEIKIRRTDNE